jgi:hypothetical protein
VRNSLLVEHCRAENDRASSPVPKLRTCIFR